MADWLGSRQSKRSAGICFAKHNAGDFARLLFSSAKRSIPERAGWFQAAARSHFRFDRVSDRGCGFTRAFRYLLFSARLHSAAKCAQFCFNAPFWAFDGFLVNLMYRTLAAWLGDRISVSIVA